MKKHITLLLILLSSAALTACEASSDSGNPIADSTSMTENTDYVTITDSDASTSAADDTNEDSEQNTHIHQLSNEDNIVEHEAAGYCGNTVTTVSCHLNSREVIWEKSFWGSHSVALTDLLLYLDYSGDVCRCLPEYTVDTEFGEDYGINLTSGYVRHDGKQADLTAEQVEEIQTIIDWLNPSIADETTVGDKK